jgi:ribosomal protein S7
MSFNKNLGISLNIKLLNTKNISNVKQIFKYLLFKKSLSIYKIKHNKFFFLPKLTSSINRQNFKISNLASFKALKVLNLYTNFINFIFRAGKKYIWDKIIAHIFILLKKTIKFSQNIILVKIFLRLHSKVEVKKVKTRKKVVFVPVFISIRRRFFLSLKWLLLAVKKNKLQIPLKDKLFFEILKLVTEKSCNSLKQLELNNKNVYLFRSNFHYRW